VQVVTYKWLGRRYNVPYDTSKRILFDFITRHPQARFRLGGQRFVLIVRNASMRSLSSPTAALLLPTVPLPAEGEGHLLAQRMDQREWRASAACRAHR
jgi:hypothetical protein